MNSLVTYSIVIPLYNEEENLPELYHRLDQVRSQLANPGELIFINDGSKDQTLYLLQKLQQQHSWVRYLSLGRNFGHQIAVTAGLNFARGQVVIVLDGDLQDPPELIPAMIKLWQEGYQVVYAQRKERLQESRWKRLNAYLFYRFLKCLAEVDIPTDTGDFCLMDRRVVDLLNQMPERHRYIRGLRSWVGFRQKAIAFTRDPRFAGKAKYTFSKSLSLALNSLVSFSKVPLRLSTYLGLTAAFLSLLMAILVLYWRLAQPDSPVTGFATIIVVIFFLGAVQLVTIGILGEYVGRIYEEVKARPLYTLAEVAGFEEP